MAATSNLDSDFLDAASKGLVEKLYGLAQKIVNRGGKETKDFKLITDDKGRNALHLAAASGMPNTCRFLIQQLKFHVDSRNIKGQTPLIVAIKKQQISTAEYLIEIGADVGCRDYKDYTALHFAAKFGQTTMLQLLLSKGAKFLPDQYSKAGTPLHVACDNGQKESVKFLLDDGAHPDQPMVISYSPMMLCVRAKSIDCMELLIKKGADPNFESYGKTPLTVAASEGDRTIIEYLLNAKANPDLPDIFGVKPIENAAFYGKVDAVKALLDATSQISSYPDWSVEGIMKEVKTQVEIKMKEKFQVFKDKGNVAFKKKEYDSAVFWYNQASFADPTDATVLSNRSLCWVKLNEGGLAFVDAEACIKLKPEWEKAHYRMGAALMLCNDYELARKAFSKALKLAPDDKEIEKAYSEASMMAHFMANMSRMQERS